jgi:hypothetical protein
MRIGWRDSNKVLITSTIDINVELITRPYKDHLTQSF